MRSPPRITHLQCLERNYAVELRVPKSAHVGPWLKGGGPFPSRFARQQVLHQVPEGRQRSTCAVGSEKSVITIIAPEDPF